MLGQENTGKFEALAVVKDNNEPAPYLYSVQVTIPSYRSVCEGHCHCSELVTELPSFHINSLQPPISRQMTSLNK